MPAIMKIFAGPPGTGKTYSAAREAVRVLIPGVAEANIPSEHRRLVEEGRIIWVTFHPSYSYEDFVEGFRPQETPHGNVTYSIVPGPFLTACGTASAAVTAGRFHKGQKLGPKGHYEVIDVDIGGVALKSSASRKDKFNKEDIQHVSFWTLRRFEAADITPADLRNAGSKPKKAKGLSKSGDPDIEKDTTEDPEVQEESHEGEGYSARQEVSRRTGIPTTFFTNSSPAAAVYEFLKGDGKSEPLDVVLVIDEINRADLSRVFGELITLLEFDKRQGAPEERHVTLTYSQRPFIVPPTLSVIGTMNTADRSLSSIDLALRRRFEFILIAPDPDLTPQTYGGVDVRAFFRAMNKRLGFIGGGDNLAGHADYMESKLDGLREREGFDDSDDGRLRAFAQTLRTKTVPFLIDLFRSDWFRVRAVVGKELFEEVDPPDDIPEELLETLNMDVSGLWRAALWWDPNGDWDGKKFLNALSIYLAPSKGAEEAPAAV